ncbi:MAG: 4-hydroxyphenylpyruvate dioxygenase, partial [Bryobacterales bacterium]|nr:4-hydroxyphenylpyruvate dioxygenase [Bryobacterales bacterium]
MIETLERHSPSTADFLPLNGTDYVEFYVGNARQAAHFYRSAFGFRLAAYRGPETGTRDRASYLLVQGKIRFILTTPLQPDHEIAGHIRIHGDGVRDVALWVDDAEAAWRETTNRGARSVRRPETQKDEHGEVPLSAIATYGDTIHTFVERANYHGAFLPGFVPVEGNDIVSRPVGLKYVDHMVGNVGWGEMNRWVEFYSHVMGFKMFRHFDDQDI